jgi:hypothetical protein
MDSPTPLSLERVLAEEYVRLHDEPCDPETAPLGDSLQELYKRIHQDARNGKVRTALSISGGGIRSATFALGVIQQLARFGILEKFDYLSTVSGGGYIGSWLSSFTRRSPGGIEDVSRQLRDGTGDPKQPEIKPIQFLRRYSNYLTPQLGLFSGDTWALVGSYVRNLLLIWVMLLPLLIALLALPRMAIGSLRRLPESALPLLEGAVTLLLLIAIGYLGLARPVHNKPRQSWFYKNSGFKWLALLPFTLAAVGILFMHPHVEEYESYGNLAAVLAGASVVSSVLYIIRFAIANRTERREHLKPGVNTGWYTVKKGLLETLAALVSGAAAGGLLYCFLRLFPNPLVTFAFPDPSLWATYPPSLPALNAELYICFGTPVILAAFFVQSTIFVGLTSWFSEDYDREWWARAAGWVLSAAASWIIFSAVTIYGPLLIWEFPRIAAALGTASGLFSVIGGKNDKSNPTGTNQKSSGQKALGVSLNTAAVLFALLILAALSLVTSEALLKYRGDQIPKPQPGVLERASKSTYQFSSVDHPPIDGRTVDRKLEIEKYPALELDRYRALSHLWIVDRSSTRECFVIIVGGVLVALFASFFIGVNRFSMNAFYRNRLIRAYLGASRWSRRPNPFTGFDPNDNIFMHKLRPESLWTHSFLNVDGLVNLLKKTAEPKNSDAKSADPKAALIQYVSASLSNRTTRLIDAYSAGQDIEAVCESLAFDFNRLIDDHDLQKREPAPEGSDPSMSLRNRDLLQTTFAGFIQPCGTGRPFHIVNTTLNLVAGDDLAWQERKGDSFSVSPLHSGNHRLGYRYSRVYGGPGGISLGTAVSISGAAASPNMGSNSSPGLAFLLTLFNVRLGWWFGNPGEAGNKTYRLPNPMFSFKPLIDEALGLTDEHHPYVYLSDGGHFENLAIYEMVLRRCHTIVVSDAGSDLSFGFEDLGNAVRKIRIDQGIEITFEKMFLFPRNDKNPVNPKYCALGTIHYKGVDGEDAVNGRLLYLKPAFYGTKEPRDVYNYAVTNDTFPHQSTGDQWFSESQFESYRALGELTLAELTEYLKVPTPDGLVDAALEYVKPRPI